MVPVDALEEVNLPEETQPLLECLILHSLADGDHRLQLINVE